jgi:hypothetical protein
MKFLADVLRDDQRKHMIRTAAYASIQAINGVPFRQRLHHVRDAEALAEKVDWKLIESIEAKERRPRMRSSKRAARRAERG